MLFFFLLFAGWGVLLELFFGTGIMALNNLTNAGNDIDRCI